MDTDDLETTNVPKDAEKQTNNKNKSYQIFDGFCLNVSSSMLELGWRTRNINMCLEKEQPMNVNCNALT